MSIKLDYLNKEDHYIVDTSHGDHKLSKVNQYGDLVDPISKPKQLELDLNTICIVTFEPNNQKLFEISGINEAEAISNSKIVVADLLRDWDDMGEDIQNNSSPYLQHMISMLKCTDSIKYKIK